MPKKNKEHKTEDKGMKRKEYEAELRELQAELCKLQGWVKYKGLRVRRSSLAQRPALHPGEILIRSIPSIGRPLRVMHECRSLLDLPRVFRPGRAASVANRVVVFTSACRRRRVCRTSSRTP